MSTGEQGVRTPVQVELAVEGNSVLVRCGDRLADRQARLFFQGVLGAKRIEGGWECPRRRTPMRTHAMRIHDWLLKNGLAIREAASAATIIDRELERRRSFLRTRSEASALKGGEDFDFTRVDRALDAFGWTDARRLRPHQRSGVAHALVAGNSANFSVPGSGKTATALAVAVTHLQSGTLDLVIVVGPLACFDPWEQEVSAAVARRVAAVRVRGSARERSDTYARAEAGQLLLLSYATAVADQQPLTEVMDHYRCMLVVDESHRIKRFRGGVWAPALLELARRARVRMVLSGTPMPQSGRDLYTQLNVLWPDGQLTGSRDAFANRVDADFGSVMRDVYPFIARTPKAALGLPPYQVFRHDVELGGTQAEVYDLIEGRFRRQLADAITWQDKLDALRRGRPIRLLQAAANPDLLNGEDRFYQLPAIQDREPTLLERLAAYREREHPAKSRFALGLVHAIANEGGKVVCWSNFVANLDAFRQLVQDATGLPCFQIDGRVPAGTDALHDDPQAPPEDAGAVDTREQIIRAFLDTDGPAVLVTNPASCSESISLHRTCHNAIYLDRTYDCALFLQSIDRIHRLGLPADAQVNIHILRATVGGRDSIDHLVDASLVRKEANMTRLLEGADISPLRLSASPVNDADGDATDLAELLKYLLGEEV